MRIAIPREIAPGEQRVAGTPQTVARLVGMGFEVAVESEAGVHASHPDDQYREAGADIVHDTAELLGQADIVLKVGPPADHPGLGKHEVDMLREGAFLACFVWPASEPDLLKRLAERKVTTFAMDQVPRVTRAQKMDALSSMSNIAGYRAVVEAANYYGGFFSGQITAAGKVPPAQVLVIGAGVAGLASIAAAKGLGAVVKAFDTRLEVKDQIESVGGEFLELEFEESGDGGGGYAKVMSDEFLEAERKCFLEEAPSTDIVITTALIPGRPAPKLWDADMVRAMKPGSVVVDLASIQGGNCELTSPGEVVKVNGVTIVGHEDLTSRLATTASQLYASNLVNLLDDMGGGEGFSIDMEDEVIRPAVVSHAGEVTWPPPESAKAAPPPPKPSAPKAPETPLAAKAKAPDRTRLWGALIGTALLLLWIRARVLTAGEPASGPLVEFTAHLTVFVLACFVGWQVVWNVTPALHTPLMSVTNAISGIIILGGLLAATAADGGAAAWLGAFAALFAMINVAGGFLVTKRMLSMFRKE
jgi:NAD(P) transhydrogenase subunit alpha